MFSAYLYIHVFCSNHIALYMYIYIHFVFFIVWFDCKRPHASIRVHVPLFVKTYLWHWDPAPIAVIG